MFLNSLDVNQFLTKEMHNNLFLLFYEKRTKFAESNFNSNIHLEDFTLENSLWFVLAEQF